MDSHRRPHHRSTSHRPFGPRNAVRYTTRRLSSLLVAAGGVVAIIAASLLEVAGVPSGMAVATGVVVFGAAVVLGTTALDETVGQRTEEASRDHRPTDARPAASADGSSWAAGTQLGPDPEQVIGRQTGARA